MDHPVMSALPYIYEWLATLFGLYICALQLFVIYLQLMVHIHISHGFMKCLRALVRVIYLKIKDFLVLYHVCISWNSWLGLESSEDQGLLLSVFSNTQTTWCWLYQFIPLVAIVGWPKGFVDGLRPTTLEIEMILARFSPPLSCIVLHSFCPIYHQAKFYGKRKVYQGSLYTSSNSGNSAICFPLRFCADVFAIFGTSKDFFGTFGHPQKFQTNLQNLQSELIHYIRLRKKIQVFRLFAPPPHQVVQILSLCSAHLSPLPCQIMLPLQLTSPHPLQVVSST